MHRPLKLIILFLVSVIFMDCTKNDDVSVIPKIEFIGMTKSTLRQGDLNQDSLWLQFRFEDGDLSYGSSDPRKDIVVKDSRTGFIQDEYKIPDLPPSENEAQKGIISILIFTSCCLFPDLIPPCSTPPQYPLDSLQFLLFIRDKAGHESNVIHSGFVKLLCQ
jgi:hypothetical protein